MKVLFRKGNRLFTLAWIFLIVAAVGHSSTQWPDEEHLNTLAASMDDYVFDNPTPLVPSLLDVFWGVWLESGVLMIGVALLNLVALVTTDGNARTKRALILVDLLIFAPMIALFIYYPIIPPLFTFSLITLLLLLDLALTRVPKPGDAG